jgi:hypothetical protein
MSKMSTRLLRSRIGRAALACLFAHAARPSFADERASGAAFLIAQATPSPPPSPCDDPQYLELRAKRLDEMSEREYEYFTRKDKECDLYRTQLITRDTTSVAPPVEQVAWPRTAETPRGPNPPRVNAGHVLGIILVSAAVSFIVVGAVIGDIFDGL